MTEKIFILGTASRTLGSNFGPNLFEDRLVVLLQLLELLVQILKSLLPVCDVDHGSSKLLWLQSLLQLYQLALLLLIWGIQSALHIHPVILVLLLVLERGVMQADYLVHAPRLLLADLQLLSSCLGPRTRAA